VPPLCAGAVVSDFPTVIESGAAAGVAAVWGAA